MKNNFQSKSVPRGTRTIWRYLSALFILFTFAIGNVWGAYYTPTADEVIILNTDAYKSDGTNYSKHAAIAWAGSPSTNSKTAGDPNNGGAATSSNVPCYSVKGNGGAKNITISITGCSKIIIYHEKHSSRYVELRSGSKTGTLIGKGAASTYYTEIALDGSTSCDLFLHGTTGSDDQDFNVYAVKLIKAPSGDPVPVTGITITPSPAAIKVGKTVTLVPTITPSNATDKAVTWAVTSGGTYASVVEATGVVTGLAEGTAVITATAHDGSGVTQTVTVNVSTCPTSGTLFSMTVTDPDGTVYTDVTDAAPKEIGATYTGGKAYATSTSSSKRSPKITGSEFDFNVGSGGSVAVKVELDCPLAEGDIITFTSTHDKNFYIRKAVGTDLHTTSSLKLEIPSGSALIGEEVFYIMRTNSACSFSAINIVRPIYRTITLEYADGVTPDGSIDVIDGEAATKPADPTWEHHRFDGWYAGSDLYDWSTTVSGDFTLTAHWTQLYTVTYAKGDESATGDAPTQADKAATETFKVAANTFELAGKVFDHWNDGTADYDPEDTYTVGTSNVTLTAIWRTPSTMYAITKGAHENGDFTIDPASQEAGEVVTLEATPDDGYLFGAWEVVKTEDASATGITVDANGQFTMPGYAVTVNATFVADPRKKILYVTNNDEATTKANDKLYAALKDDYRISIVSYGSDADQTNYDLVVLHESIGGGNYGATAVAAAKAGNTPVLNTKSYFYNDGRWGWGAPNAGQSVKGATMNSSYCNIADHPLFDGVTMTAGFFEITDDAAAKCMQPVGSFTSGKEGYTLATTPNNGEGNGCAIHELTPAQRGASAGKYLMISVSGDKLNALNANGQKLFQNAAAYLIGSTAWEPIAVPTAAVIEAAPSAAYSVGDNIALSALAAGVSAATTYTWYKGDTWAEAETAGAIQAAKTAADSGDSFGITGCALGDEGTYWCVISNGTDCEAKASLTVTVTDASYNITFVSAHGAAPTATTGVSYTLPTLTESGWAHQGWTASIDVEVDAATVNAGDLIANGKMAVFAADVEFTAVWKQIFAVTFNLNGQSGSIAPQDIIDGEKATKPADPVVIGWDFGGWFTDEECTAGNEFDFDTPITAATPLYAKWTAFAGCTMLYPALSGDALHVGNNVAVQTGSEGGVITIVGMKTDGSSIAYNENGLSLNGGGADVISVTLNNDMAVDTKISVTLVAANTGSRGLNLLNATGGSVAGGTKLGWDDATLGEVGTFSYTVTASDGLEGTNIFRLQRNNSVYLQCVKVESCGAAITYHNLTSAVNIAGKGTVTLGATSVREGYTTTAEYSDIDPLYEFVNWTVSGAGASVENATANPATITVGTEDAVVTLNLQLIPEKFTVNYYDGASLMGSELVAVNEHPTAAGIETTKRHYTFQGWSETEGGAVIDLNDITRTEATTVELYAKYEPVACPTSGTIFSVEIDDTKIPASTVKVAKNGGTLDVADYVIISGGKAIFINDESSDKDAISTSGQFKLVATKAVLKVELDCVLQENDIIRIDNNQKWVVSTSKTKSGTYQALTSSEHKFAVTAAWAGVDDLYFLYDGSSLSFTQIEVYRPGRYDVSFDMMGHGSAIADIEDVLEGSKITAPTAPTDEDYAFAGWYKENTLENEWDFDNDVVNAATTLYAKWINKSDATLKSLKYGSDEISLEDGVYEYEIALAAAVASVPALTAVTNNPAATAVVTDAAAFDEDGKATSTVVVTPEKEGAPTQTYTVNFTKLAALPQVGVSASTLWNFSLEGSTSLQNVEDVVLANLPGIVNDETFNSQALLASFNKLEGSYFQGSKLMFTVAEEGLLTIEFSGTNNHARHLQVCTGDGEIVIADWDYNSSSTHQTKSIEIPAGKITLKAFEGEGAQNARIYTLEYLALADRREAAWVAPGELGTVCLKDNAKALGAKVFEVMGCNASGYMVFDEILSGEIEAGRPYLFEVTRNGSVAFFKTVGAAHSDDEIEVMGMIGTFDGVTLHPDDGNYCYFSGRHIWRVNDFSVDIPVPAYCCYVNYDELKNHPIAAAAPAPGRRRVIMGVNGKDEAQGFENLNASETPMKVMIDGTLYILRGEKVFDATGRLVK